MSARRGRRLFNWLFARQSGGTFVLRVEDTDAARNRPEHTEGILRSMQWLGLDWDEGPYFQSQRRSLYDAAIEKLIAAGAVYACDCTPEQIDQRAKERGGPPATTDIAVTRDMTSRRAACSGSGRPIPARPASTTW